MKLSGIELKFVIDQELIEIGPVEQKVFEKKWNELPYYEQEETDRFNFEYRICVAMAISKVVGKEIFVHNRSANIAFEAYFRGGDFCGNHTVYSDYISMNSIDSGHYRQVVKSIEKDGNV